MWRTAISAEIINLGDIGDENEDLTRFHEFLENLKVGQKRFVCISFSKDNQVQLGSSAKNPAELIILLHHLKKFNEYLVEQYADIIIESGNEEEDDE